MLRESGMLVDLSESYAVSGAMHRSHSLAVGKTSSLENGFEEAVLINEKYKRLMESHHKLLKVNQNLEDKLLRVVSNSEDEKRLLREQINELTEALAASQSRVSKLEHENKKYREDCLLAVELLQCNPSNFLDHSVDTLPSHLRSKLSVSPSPSTSTAGGDDLISFNKASLEPESRPGSDITVLPLPFPPSAVMVPRSSAQQAAASRGSASSSRRMSAGTIASLIDRDLRELNMSNCDLPIVVEKPPAVTKSAGTILHL